MPFAKPTNLIGPIEPLDAYSRLLDVVIAGSPGNQAETLQALHDAVPRYQHNGAVQRVTHTERNLLNHLQMIAGCELLAPSDEYGFTLDAPAIDHAADGSHGQRPTDKPDAPSPAEPHGQSRPEANAHQAATSPASPAPVHHAFPSAQQGKAKHALAREFDPQRSAGGRLDQPLGKPSCK